MLGWLPVSAGAVVGLAIGSFIGAVAMRLPRGEGVAMGRSHCDTCDQVLSARDLVPILSFIAASGRCRTCGTRIDRAHILAESGGAIVGAAAVLSGQSWSEAVVTALLGWQLLLLALLDGQHFWLPLRLVALLAVTAALSMLAAGEPFARLAMMRIAGGALGFALLAGPALAYRMLRRREGLGAADPWLLGAIGLWLGPIGVIFTLLLAALAGLAAAVVLRLSGRFIDGQSAVPLGTLLALAGFAVHLVGPYGGVIGPLA